MRASVSYFEGLVKIVDSCDVQACSVLTPEDAKGAAAESDRYPLVTAFFNCCFHPNTRALFPSASASGTIPFF
jgi:hypothetical protein